MRRAFPALISFTNTLRSWLLAANMDWILGEHYKCNCLWHGREFETRSLIGPSFTTVGQNSFIIFISTDLFVPHRECDFLRKFDAHLGCRAAAGAVLFTPGG